MSNKTRPQQSGTRNGIERICSDPSGRRDESRFFRSRALPRFLDSHLPRHAAPPTAAPQRSHDDSFHISLCIANLEWTESKEHCRFRVRTPRVSRNNQWRWGWPSNGWWHSQAFSKRKSRSLPGDRPREDLGPVCPLADTARHCPRAFLCWFLVQDNSILKRRPNNCRLLPCSVHGSRVCSTEGWFDDERLSATCGWPEPLQ
jgi:hypothetical protein